MWHNRRVPGGRERNSDERVERLQQEVVRLRDELARSETDRPRVERERAGLERENARLKLEAARRAGARQAAPLSQGWTGRTITVHVGIRRSVASVRPKGRSMASSVIAVGKSQ